MLKPTHSAISILKLILILLVGIFSASCNSEITQEDICGKTYTQEYESAVAEGVQKSYTTKLNCDGTFSSQGMDEFDTEYTDRGYSAKQNNSNFIGSWKVVNEIPNNLLSEINSYGLEENASYTVISYKSSNNYSGYCLIHRVNGKLNLSPLVIDSKIKIIYETKDSGIIGIYGGFQ